jgi:predicted metal-binding protein
MKKIGIIICDRWRRCAGGKCLRALEERQGAFSRYQGQEVELAGYTTCDGCPGGNVEYAPAEMKRNGVGVIHLATGLLVGYPPCPYIDDFTRFIEEKFDMDVVLGTHPIPQNYFVTHEALGTWNSPVLRERIQWTMTDESIRKSYD